MALKFNSHACDIWAADSQFRKQQQPGRRGHPFE